MRIVVVHNHYQQRGGEDVVFDAEFELLTSRGHTVERYTVHNDAVTRLGRASLAVKTIWNRDAYRQLRALFHEFRPDIVHVHNTFPLISPSVYLAARAEGAAVVQTLHNYRLICPSAMLSRNDVPCELCVGRTVPWPAVRYACYRNSRVASAVTATMLFSNRALGTYGHVDRFIALTQFARDRFIAGGLDADAISVKPNFAPHDAGFGEGAGGYVAFVGRLSTEKGLADLLSAWRILGPLVPLRIIGDGPMAAEVRRSAREIGGIEVLGHMDATEVAAQLRGATALIFPTRVYEGLPMSIIEAFAAGTPVIASRIGAAAEIITHERTGLLVTPGDPRSFADAVRWLYAHPLELAEMRYAARLEYERKYTPDENYSQLMDIYQRASHARRCRVAVGRDPA